MIHNNFVIGNSADVIRQMSYLYFPKGARIADVTHGDGVFGKGVDRKKYVYDSSDLHKGGETQTKFYDFRKLPYRSNSYQVVFLDVPWGCHSFYSHAQDFERAYENRYGGDEHKLTPAYVWSLFEDGMRECVRILADRGVLVVKVQDKMVGNKQRRYEIEVWHYALDILGLKDVAKYILAVQATDQSSANNKRILGTALVPFGYFAKKKRKRNSD